MAKAELFQFKPFGFILKKLGAFPVQRGKGDVEAIDAAAELLHEECAIGDIIEGTRSKDGELGKPKAGAVMLAYQNQAPILPVCITPVGSKKPRLFHRTIISIGELIPCEQLGIQRGYRCGISECQPVGDGQDPGIAGARFAGDAKIMFL